MLRDIRIQSRGDIVVDSYGDIALFYEGEAIVSSLVRRLSTPEVGYGRYYRTEEGLEVADGDYGNRLYEYLSTGELGIESEYEEALREAAAGEERIEILGVRFVGQEGREVQLELLYKLDNNPSSYIFNVQT